MKRPRGEARDEAARVIVRGSEVRAPAGRRCSRCQKLVKREDDNGSEPPYCTSDCSEAARAEVSHEALRRQVLERDKGVCASCGQDCLDLRAQVDALRDAAKASLPAVGRLTARIHGLVRVGFDRHALEEGHALWECDHVDPRVKGGPNTLSNARTLCISCHHEATRALAGSRAASRKVRR